MHCSTCHGPNGDAAPAILHQPDVTIFDAIKAGDILLHHPYDSFSPVAEMIERASTDSKTVAIKMTLYRTNADSPILPALNLRAGSAAALALGQGATLAGGGFLPATSRAR